MKIGVIKTNSKSDGKGNWTDGWDPNPDTAPKLGTQSKSVTRMSPMFGWAGSA